MKETDLFNLFRKAVLLKLEKEEEVIKPFSPVKMSIEQLHCTCWHVSETIKRDI
jgi:hypothetical protein